MTASLTVMLSVIVAFVGVGLAMAWVAFAPDSKKDPTKEHPAAPAQPNDRQEELFPAPPGGPRTISQRQVATGPKVVWH